MNLDHSLEKERNNWDNYVEWKKEGWLDNMFCNLDKSRRLVSYLDSPSLLLYITLTYSTLSYPWLKQNEVVVGM